MAPPPSMAFYHLSLLAVLTYLMLLAASTGAQWTPPPTAFAPSSSSPLPSSVPLAERLEGAVAQQCWEALLEVKSCTGEIIILFIKGEAFLGPACCRAVRVIEQSCSAADSMLSVVGFTPQEGDMLKGYCDAGDGNSPSPPPSGVVDAVAGRKSLMHRR